MTGQSFYLVNFAYPKQQSIEKINLREIEIFVEKCSFYCRSKFRSSCRNQDDDGSTSLSCCRNRRTCYSCATDCSNSHSIRIASCRTYCTSFPERICQPESKKKADVWDKRVYSRQNIILLLSMSYLVGSRFERLVVPRYIGIGPDRVHRFRVIVRSVTRRVLRHLFFINGGHGRLKLRSTLSVNELEVILFFSFVSRV